MSDDQSFDFKAFVKEIEDMHRAAIGNDEYEHMRVSQAAMRVARKEPARSVGIVWGSTLETTLRLAIIRHMTLSGRFSERAAHMFKPSGPLGPFANKIDLGGLLHIYNETVWRELVTIKEIRNAFAHKFETDSFESDQISALTGNLRFIENFIRHRDGQVHIEHSTYTTVKMSTGYNEDPLATPKDRFMRTCDFYDQALRDARPKQPHPDLHFVPPVS